MHTISFQLFSDIHTEFSNGYPQIPLKCPYLILAGDIGKLHLPNFKNFIDYCAKNWKKTIYVLGNHEYYHHKTTFTEIKEKYTAFFASYENVSLLDDNCEDLEAFLIVGSTLWSKVSGNVDSMNDFVSIKEHTFVHESKRTTGLSVDTFNKLHEKSKNYIIETVHAAKKPVIVVTHFPPIQNGTSDPKFNGQDKCVKDYFASNVMDENEFDKSKIACWIYGHTHYSNDFYYKGVRIISNQIGYARENCEFSGSGIFEICSKE